MINFYLVACPSFHSVRGLSEAAARSVIHPAFVDSAVIQKIVVCVFCVLCSNSRCDLNCVYLFMMFPCIFVGLYISSCPKASSFQPFVSPKAATDDALMEQKLVFVIR